MQAVNIRKDVLDQDRILRRHLDRKKAIEEDTAQLLHHQLHLQDLLKNTQNLKSPDHLHRFKWVQNLQNQTCKA